MTKTGIYQVYYDASDDYYQCYIDLGYFKNLENAVEVYKNEVLDRFDKMTEVNGTLLEEQGYVKFENRFGISVVLCEIVTED